MKKNLLCAVILVGLAGNAVGADPDLQSAIDQAKPGDTVWVAEGTWTIPVKITKSVVLRGRDASKSVLEVTADQPAIHIQCGTNLVRLESLTIRWQRASSATAQLAPVAVLAQDSTAVLRDCRVIAAGNAQRCPSAVAAEGFSQVTIERCQFEGFEFTIQYWRGANGGVTECVVRNPGHCGITVGPSSKVSVWRNLVTGSAYHGIRCTGGTIEAWDNLVVRNKNRGFYLGNKAAKGSLRNNLILENTTGISAFGGTEMEIKHNVIWGSDFAALDTRDGCALRVEANVLGQSTRGLVVFDELGARKFQVGTNAFWANKTNLVNLELAAGVLEADPRFKSASSGDFSIGTASARLAGQGLSDAAIIQQLWNRWRP